MKSENDREIFTKLIEVAKRQLEAIGELTELETRILVSCEALIVLLIDKCIIDADELSRYKDSVRERRGL